MTYFEPEIGDVRAAPLHITLGLALVILGLSDAVAADTEIVIDGTAFAASEKSVKCDIGEIADVSKKRLVDCHSATLVEVSHEAGKSRAVRFTISPFDEKISDGTRAELRDMHEAVNGEMTWYRFGTLLPENFPIDADHRLVLSQWHERVREGGDSLRPPLSHRLWNGRFVVTLWNKDRIAELGLEGDGQILFDLPQLERGVFHDFVYKIRWSPDADGEIVGWMRTCPALDANCAGGTWRQIINYHGSTGYESSKIKSYYFKLGLYTVTDFDVPFTAYHRNYRVGVSAAEVDATGADFR